MPSYLVAGLVLTTDLDLPELPRTGEADDGWTVAPGDPGDPLPTLHELLDDAGDLWAVLAGGDGTFQLRFPGLGDFLIDVDRRSVHHAIEPGVADSTVRHLLIDQVVPHLLAIDGSMVLHASGVGFDGAAVALVGPSGAGKSSLAAALVRDGATLLGDDFLLVTERDGGYDAVPAYPGLRLWSDSAEVFAAPDELAPVAQYTAKQRWAPGEAAPGADALPLAAIIFLGHPDPGGPPCRVGPVGGSEAYMVLFQQAFRMERAGREVQTRELDRYVRIATTVPLLVVEFERRYDVLPEVVTAVTTAVSDLRT